ncbi:MAG: hypothetical protein ABMB14_15320 [Myxococcota bacterium]
MSRSILVAAWLTACTGSAPTDADDATTPDDADTDTDADADADSDADTDTDTDTDADTDADTDTGPEHPEPTGPGVTGVVVGADGGALGGTQVLACSETWCVAAPAEDDGWFWVALPDEQEPLAIKVAEDLSTDPRRGAAIEPMVLGPDPVDIGDLYVPDLPAGAPWGPVEDDPQRFDAGDGLELTIRRADLTVAVFTTFDDVAAARIPDAYVPEYPELSGDAVVAVYAVHPFDALSSSPIEVRAPTTLPDGAAVEFRSISIFGGHLSEPALGHASGGFVTTDPGEGLFELTYVVISTPSTP